LERALQIASAEPETLKTLGLSETRSLQRLLVERLRRVTESADELERSERACKICFEPMASNGGVVFVPCGHHASCKTCASRVKECPICNATIKIKQQVFGA
jgi:hypothetical protein